MKNGRSLDRSSRIRCRIDQRCGTSKALRSAVLNFLRAELFSVLLGWLEHHQECEFSTLLQGWLCKP